MRKAFTVIELLFVVVILGILSAVALPKFESTKNLADISKGRSDVAAIRSAILTERQARLIRGVSGYVSKLCDGGPALFTGSGDAGRGPLLQYGIIPGTDPGQWSDAGGCTKFKYHTAGGDVLFTYTQATGTFTCNRANTICKKMID